MLRFALALPLALTLFALPTAAQQQVTPTGAWVKDIRGKSRTPDNLAYLNRQVVKAQQVAENEWKGTVVYDGSQAAATVKQVSPDTIKITGCRMVFCQTLTFNRV
jgi:hypothetical protein